MKKKILMWIASLMLTFSATYAKSNNTPVPSYISSIFSSDFNYANSVTWEEINGYYKVNFIEHGISFHAFYTSDGEFMGIGTYLRSDRLPASLLTAVKEKYKGYWISDLFEFKVNNIPGYFITLENADHKVMLKAEEDKTWTFYSEVKKG